ncbi:MAG: hypothetical protein Q7S88_01200 [Candidatus Daviesbacteria bacterium]|nr:hypothetical protein [Candidatus Daviesbacteria bacterium]
MTDLQFSFRNIAYQEKDGSFTGVCLDLDIVEEGRTTLQEAILSINDAISSHFKAAKKMGLPNELINRPAPKEYWDKLKEITREQAPKRSFSPFQFFTTQSSGLVYA